MTTLAVHGMAHRLTAPFERGGDTSPLFLEADGSPNLARVVDYDFADHRARFGRLPDPSYVLTTLRDVVIDTAVHFSFILVEGGPLLDEVTVVPDLIVPAGSLAGMSFVVATTTLAPAALRLRTLRMTPPPPDANAAALWRLDALLGNTAKLLWVIGWEKDHLRRQGERVQAQRSLPDAEGASLDRLGADLAVPRFPPLPYGFDLTTRTVALFHLDDEPSSGEPEVDTAEDAMRRYGGPGHPATNVGRLARSRAIGRFGRASAGGVGTDRMALPRAFEFRDPNAELQIADHPDFAIAAGESFTVECFFKPAGGRGAVISKHADPGDASLPGWAISVGDFARGISHNVRFLCSDGSRVVELFADLSLSPERFYHLAGTVDLAAGEARLYVDGQLRRSFALGADEPPFAALTNNEPIRIGHTTGTPDLTFPPGGANACPGVIDEVRLSRSALRVFAPVLGEADAPYRHRLQLFERWALPTPGRLQDFLNEAVGKIGGMDEPLIVDDVDTTLLHGAHIVTIDLPDRQSDGPPDVEVGGTIDADGNRSVREADVCGVAADDGEFAPDFLIALADDARVSFAPPPSRELTPGELPPAPNKMQLVVERRLQALLDLLPGGAPLHVESGFDPRATDLRVVGRGLIIRHDVLGPVRLAALAHNAGFAFVNHLRERPAVYVSMPIGNQLEIESEAAGGEIPLVDGVHLQLGKSLTLRTRPAIPPGTRYRWRTVACGHGRATLSSATGEPAVTEPTVVLTATAPGTLVVVVDAIRRQHTATGAIALRVGPPDLSDGETIADDGSAAAGQALLNDSSVPFHPLYLVTRDDDLADYGVGANDRRMQPAVSARLDRLLELAAGTGAGGRLAVETAYNPADTGPAGSGRNLTLRHSALPPGQLGALAHAAGFSRVHRNGAIIEVSQRPGDFITITGPNRLAVGESIDLAATPRALPNGVTAGAETIVVVNTGTESVSSIDRATGRVARVFKVGRRPSALAVTPDGARCFIADTASSTVTAIDLAAGGVSATIPMPGPPVALLHHPTDPRLYVACVDGAELVRVDTDVQTILDSLTLSNEPAALAVRPDGGEVWVTIAGGAIEVVDAATMASTTTIPLSGEAAGIAISPDGTTAAVTLPASKQLALIDVAARSVSATVEVGESPGPLTYAPDGSAIFVVDQIDERETLFVLAPNGAPRASARIRRQPTGVAAVADRVYVTNAGSDDVSVLTIAADRAELTDTWALGSGLGEQLAWVVRPNGPARARLSSTTSPEISLTAETAGVVMVRAVYAQAGAAAPYTFAVRLRPELAATSAVIRKDQYDLIMNILNAFHPIGVEVATRAIRERVIEVREELLEAFPDYTYPRFRVRRVVPPPQREE